MSTLENKLKFAVTNNLNVMLIGHAGVGKTSIVKGIFEEMGLKYLYYSASTMDPWVDFVGVPHEVTGSDGVTYLDLVRPKAFAYDDVEAIFLDEYNRSPIKVRNAVMELIQFKSINGKIFNNLKIVWAAINPSEEDDSGKTYDVEPLDPAQLDRFQFHIEIPYSLNKKYFATKYPKYSDAVIEWWNALPKQQREAVSPRRVDMALDTLEKGGDINWVLGKGINCAELMDSLNNGTYTLRIREHFSNNDAENAKALINNADRILSKYVKVIINNKDYLNFYMPFFTDEQLSKLIANNNETIIEYVQRSDIAKTRYDLIRSIVNSKSVKSATLDRFKSTLKALDSKKQIQTPPIASTDPRLLYIAPSENLGLDLKTNFDWYNHCDEVVNELTPTTPFRAGVFNALYDTGGGIYKITDKDTLRKIFTCTLKILAMTTSIKNDVFKCDYLARLLNTVIKIADDNSYDFGDIVDTKSNAEMLTRALKVLLKYVKVSYDNLDQRLHNINAYL